jgi:hypothetical protein
LLIIVGAALTGRGDPRVFAGMLTVVTAARAATHGRFDHWIERGVVALGKAIGATIYALIFVVTFVPAHVIGRRRWARDRQDSPAWMTRKTPLGGGERHLSTGGPTPRHPMPQFLLRSVGLVAVILVANYAIGAAWDGLSPRSRAPLGTASPTRINVSGSQAPRDPRSDDPAMGGAPWAEDYWLFGLQGGGGAGVTVASRSQLGRPA